MRKSLLFQQFLSHMYNSEHYDGTDFQWNLIFFYFLFQWHTI